MRELRELYQDVILDHSRNPRNFRQLEGANRQAEGSNPLCGDHFTVYLRMDGNRIAEATFEGQGCAISKSSASMMTDAVRGKTEAEAHHLFAKFHEMVTGEPGASFDRMALGKLAVFSGVCEFPVRVKCASLPWHTLVAALEEKGKVTTE